MHDPVAHPFRGEAFLQHNPDRPEERKAFELTLPRQPQSWPNAKIRNNLPEGYAARVL
jgi:hypothetical protein